MEITQLIELAASDPPEVPLKNFFLGSGADRQNFLRELYNRGKAALFEAVAHVWASLEEPRAYRCTLMGIASGSGGSARTALMKTLTEFVNDAMAIDNPLPDRADYGSLAEWHEAAMASFAADEADLEVLLERYSKILNGDVPSAGLKR